MKCPECHNPNTERTGLDDADGFQLECTDCGYQFWTDEWPEDEGVEWHGFFGWGGLK